MEITDKVIVVTGGACGIGTALCRKFAREGAKAVVVADIDEQGAKVIAGEIGGIPFRCDVTKEKDVIRVVEETEEKTGPIDLFCSNAGIMVPGGVEVANEDWQRIWEINVLAHIHAARTMIPRMIERGGGYLLNMVSAAGLLTQIGSTPYSVTKHAAVGLAENIAITYGDRGIKVSLVCPEGVRTSMGREDGVEAVDGLLEPAQVADAVLEGLAEERFLILPHPQVQTYMERKVSDYERWIKGMRKLQKQFPDGKRRNGHI